MCEAGGAIDALPDEGVVGEGVGEAPAQLLGDKPFHSGTHHDLGKLGRVAEGVRQPELW